MKREDILNIAYSIKTNDSDFDAALAWNSDPFIQFANLVAAAARAEEREACARLCENNELVHSNESDSGKALRPIGDANGSTRHDGQVYAAAIRSRSDEPTKGQQ